jgi:hypothetical protein
MVLPRHSAQLVWVLLACAAFAESAIGQNRIDEPDFSARAIPIYHGKQVRSPDKRIVVRLIETTDSQPGTRGRLVVTSGGEQLTSSFDSSLDAEILWSPDSKAFSISGSSSSANGPYQTDVFFIDAGRLSSVHLTNLIRNEFGHPVRCGWPEPPNVASVKWLAPSQRLLVVAEIMHHSNCDSFGTFKAYEVELQPLGIGKRYDQLLAKQLFRTDLGAELLQSNDNCIRNPKICHVATNWQSKQ